MQLVRGLLRIFAVGFTVVSLMLVAAVAVAASSGRAGSSNAITNSVGALFAAPLVSGHSAQAGVQSGATTNGTTTNGTTTNGTTTVASNSNAEDNGNGKSCKPHGKHHHHATGDRENDKCGGDDSGSS
jgi:hypothetical protein